MSSVVDLSLDGKYASDLWTVLDLGLKAEMFIEDLEAAPESERRGRRNGWLCVHVWALANAMSPLFEAHATTFGKWTFTRTLQLILEFFAAIRS